MISTVKMSVGEYAGKGGRGGGRGTEREGGIERERGGRPRGGGGGGGGGQNKCIFPLRALGITHKEEINNLNKTKTKAEKEEKS